MTGPETIAKLLGAIHRVSGVRFALRDAAGKTRFTTDACPENQWVTRDGGGAPAHSIPLAIEHGESLLLQARLGAATRPDASGVEHLLAQLRALTEDLLNRKNEAEKLTEELDRSYEHIYLFSRIAAHTKSMQFSEAMMDKLIADILDTMRVQGACAVFPERPQHNVFIRDRLSEDMIPDLRAFMDGVIAALPGCAPVFEDNCFIVNRSSEIPPFDGMAPAPFRVLAVKISHAGTFYGWVILVSFEMGEIFRRGEYRLLSSMAEQIALVIANTDLYGDLQSFVINVVKSLIYAIEAKDIYTRGHSERVSGLCMRMADRLGLDGQDRNDLQWASILHDIGKIGTPESILNKPGRLTDDEFAFLKRHPSKGSEILEPMKQLTGSVPGILHHHERYDGKGYPGGLRGEAIPLAARIIAVADTFDAITSSRAYRPARPAGEAIRIVRESAATQLDPDLVRVLIGILEDEASDARGAR